MFLCPSYPPLKFTDWFRTYGVRLDPPTNSTRGTFQEYLHVDSLPNPTEYLHVADTTSRGRQGIGSQQFYFFRVASEKEVHARHTLKANGLFMDGHIESCRGIVSRTSASTPCSRRTRCPGTSAVEPGHETLRSHYSSPRTREMRDDPFKFRRPPFQSTPLPARTP